MTNKEEYNKMIKQIFGDKLRKGLKEFIYQWHIQQQIKLLEEVKKDLFLTDLGDVCLICIGDKHFSFLESGERNNLKIQRELIDSKITNLKKEL